MRCIVAIVLFLGLSSAGQSQEQTIAHRSLTTSQLHWTATVIPNLEMAVVSGDPATKGPFVVRLRATGQVRVPAHWHAADEHLIVLAGSPEIGMGDLFATTALRPLHPGEKILLPKEIRHFARFKAGTEVQLQGDGPFTISWVNPDAIKALRPKNVDSNSERSKMKAEQEKR